MGNVAALFSKRWDYKLTIKHVFVEADVLPTAAESIRMGAQIAVLIRALQTRVPDTSDLFWELDDCAETFADLDGIDNAFEARDRFNAALADLYNVGDQGKRVWIE